MHFPAGALLEPANRSFSPVAVRAAEMPAAAAHKRGRSGAHRLAPLVALYAALIVFGSLYPFTGWSEPTAPWFSFLTNPLPERFDRADLALNVLAYAPLGLLTVVWLGGRRFHWSAVFVATVAGTSLSFIMETIQETLPSRSSSNVDLLTNLLGTLLGALAAGFVSQQTFAGRTFLNLRDSWVRKGNTPDLGLIVLALWALSQTAPLVPSLDVANLRAGLAPLWQTFQAPETFNSAQMLTYALYILGLAMVARTLARPGKPMLLLFLAFVAGTLLFKIPVVGRELSLEAVSGAAVAALASLPLWLLKERAAAWCGICIILAGFASAELAPGSDPVLRAFNWVPFLGQMNTLAGLTSILENIWPFAALAYFARWLTRGRSRTETVILGTVGVAFLAFALEWYQQYLPGRYGDITVLCLALGGWLAPWWMGRGEPLAKFETAQRQHRRSRAERF
jgi:VanZ family protein